MDISTIQHRIAMIEKYKEEIKVAKEALKNELDADQDFSEVSKAAKDAAAKKKQIRDQIWGQPHTRKLLDDIAGNNEEIATLQEILNEELMAYYQEHKTNEILRENGDPIKFKVIVKLLAGLAGEDDR